MVAPKARGMDAEQLRALLSYDPETGVFRWRVRVGQRVKPGDVAGTHRGSRGGYVRISIGRRSFLAHRLAWLHVHGEWPAGTLDHRDGDPTNNRLSNLRTATAAQNIWNQGPTSRNASGHRGVYRHPRGGWGASIQANGKRRSLGRFNDLEVAAQAYRVAALALHGEFARSA